MTNRLAKNVITESEETAASTNFSLCMAMLTLAHAMVEGKNTENLQSDEKRQRSLPQNIERITSSTISHN